MEKKVVNHIRVLREILSKLRYEFEEKIQQQNKETKSYQQQNSLAKWSSFNSRLKTS